LIDFAGFVQRPGSVELLYSHNYFFPPKPGQSFSFVAATSLTGGRSWIDVRLGCPAGAPCVIFGPQAPQGACGMSEWQQSVLVGHLEETIGADFWRPAGSVSTVSQCGSQELVATTSGDEFLIDRSRADALHYTRDGTHWTRVSLPKIDGAPVAGQASYLGQLMTLAASSVLVAVAGSPLSTTEHLEVLEPGSNSWCTAKATLPAATRQHPVAAIESSESRLVVAFFTPIPTGHAHNAMALTFPLSMLSCRSSVRTQVQSLVSVNPTSNATPASDVAVGLPRCNAKQLHVWDYTPLEGAADYGVMVVRLKNESAHGCTLSGYPSVQGINQWNGAVRTAAHTRDSYMGGWESTKPLPVVALRAKAGVASFLVDYITGDDIHACPYLNTLRVKVPDSTTVFTLTSTELQACKHFEVHPFVPGLMGTAQ